MANLFTDLSERHPYASLIFYEIRLLLLQSLGSLRAKGFSTFTALLAKHDLDSRYQTVEAKQRIAGIYFPIILMVSNILHHVRLFNLYICEISDLL
jgi:hypothetical protein